MTDELPDYLAAYLAKQDTYRAEQVRSALLAMTDRERALVKDAAVMGYVRGMGHPEGVRVPKDGVIMFHVVLACLYMPDLYPGISGRVSDADVTEER